MPERKVWSQEEDRILKYLREERGQRKWAAIARIMESEFHILGRTGKQCRERYHNHLDSKIITSDWTIQEEEILYTMHEEMGNKWALIAQKLPGRSDNCVKNHFYSKLRKTLRRINKLINQYFAKQLPIIRTNTLSKLIQASQSKFKISSKVDEELADFCNNIINRLFRFTDYGEEQVTGQLLEDAKEIVQDLQNFELSYKKGYKVAKHQQHEKEYKTYLKPPTFKIHRLDSSGSASSERSEDSSLSFLSSNSCSFMSDSEEEQPQEPKSRSTRSFTLRNSSGAYSDISNKLKEGGRVYSCGEVDEQNEKDRWKGGQSEGLGLHEQNDIFFHDNRINVKEKQHVVMEPGQFEQVHLNIIESEYQNNYHEVNSNSNSQNMGRLNYNNLFYEDTPVMARILGPHKMQEEDEFHLFKDEDNEEIQYKEQ